MVANNDKKFEQQKDEPWVCPVPLKGDPMKWICPVSLGERTQIDWKSPVPLYGTFIKWYCPISLEGKGADEQTPKDKPKDPRFNYGCVPDIAMEIPEESQQAVCQEDNPGVIFGIKLGKPLTDEQKKARDAINGY